MGEKKIKKGPAVGTLMTASGTRIPVSFTKEKERRQLRETLQLCTMEKRVTNVPFLEGAGPSGLELQKKALKEASRRKATMEAVKAIGEGTSS